MRPPNLFLGLSAVFPTIWACNINTPGPYNNTSTSTGGGELSSGDNGDGSGDDGSSTTSSSSNPSGDGHDATSNDSTSTGTTGSVDASSTAGTDTGDTSTGGALCLNGVREADEECDDGNDDPDDGCNNSCGRDRVVFVSSKVSSPAQMGSAKLAGDFCKQLAGAAGLVNASTFNVWLSDSKLDARDRVFRGRGRYVLVDGRVVADSFDALMATELKNPIEMDEYGALVVDSVWTGSNPDGTLAAGATQCKDWSSSEWMELGHYGSTSSTEGKWTFHPDPEANPTSCAIGNRTYCFEGE